MPLFRSCLDTQSQKDCPSAKPFSRQYLRTVAAASVLALASLSGVALAADPDGDYSSDDGDLRSEACGVIGCADGARECARAVGTVRHWVWVPLPPYFFPIPIPVDTQLDFACYERGIQ